MGTAGCNMGCFFCQNWDISKSRQDQVHSTYMPPEDVVAWRGNTIARRLLSRTTSQRFWGEYVVDILPGSARAGIATVMVSNGYITREAFLDIYDNVDAANIDLKAFTEEFTGASR